MSASRRILAALLLASSALAFLPAADAQGVPPAAQWTLSATSLDASAANVLDTASGDNVVAVAWYVSGTTGKVTVGSDSAGFKTPLTITDMTPGTGNGPGGCLLRGATDSVWIYVYAYSSAGVVNNGMKSVTTTDGGTTWGAAVTVPSTTVRSQKCDMARMANGNTILCHIGTDAGSVVLDAAYSTNDGASWTDASVPSISGASGPGCSMHPGGYMFVTRNISGSFYASMSQSTDNGLTWGANTGQGTTSGAHNGNSASPECIDEIPVSQFMVCGYWWENPGGTNNMLMFRTTSPMTTFGSVVTVTGTNAPNRGFPAETGQHAYVGGGYFIQAGSAGGTSLTMWNLGIDPQTTTIGTTTLSNPYPAVADEDSWYVFGISGGLKYYTTAVLPAPDPPEGLTANVALAYDGTDSRIELRWPLSPSDTDQETGDFTYKIYLDGVQASTDTVTSADGEGTRYNLVVLAGSAAYGVTTFYIVAYNGFVNSEPSCAVQVDDREQNDVDTCGDVASLGGLGLGGSTDYTTPTDTAAGLKSWCGSLMGDSSGSLFLCGLILVAGAYIALAAAFGALGGKGMPALIAGSVGGLGVAVFNILAEVWGLVFGIVLIVIAAGLILWYARKLTSTGGAATSG